MLSADSILFFFSGETPVNLLLLQESDRTAPDRFQVAGRRAEHIRKVLRAKVGDRLRAGLSGGRIGSAEVIRLHDP